MNLIPKKNATIKHNRIFKYVYQKKERIHSHKKYIKLPLCYIAEALNMRHFQVAKYDENFTIV